MKNFLLFAKVLQRKPLIFFPYFLRPQLFIAHLRKAGKGKTDKFPTDLCSPLLSNPFTLCYPAA